MTLPVHGRPRVRGQAIVAALLASVVAACGTPPKGDAPAVASGVRATLPAPAALKMTGVEPVPQSLVDAVGGYTEFRGARLVDWEPQGRGLVVTWRHNDRVQLHRIEAAQAPLQPLTRADEPVRAGAYVPAQPSLLVYARDTAGDEVTRLYRLDTATGAETPLTPPGRRHAFHTFNRAGDAFYATSVPIDRSADGSVEAAAPARPEGALQTQLMRIDPAAGTSEPVATLPGTGWTVTDASDDDRTLLLVRFYSVARREVWSLERGASVPKRLLPRDGEAPGAYGRATYTAEGDILLTTDRGGEFDALARFDPRSGRIETVSGDIAWDVELAGASRDRRAFAVLVNEGGRGTLRIYDVGSRRLRPVAVPAGVSVLNALLSPDGRRLAVTYTSSAEPSAVHVIDLASETSVQWTRSDTGGLDTSRFGATEVVTWPSFDGRRISGLITRPDPKRFPGRRPVLMQIHGGPEAQARIGFLGRDNYLVNELGIAVIAPNVRGSAGFGKTFLGLDDGMKREDAVRDIGALLDWIAVQPDLDPARVAVYGGSYGGYMVHATAVHYSARIRAAIAVVGISHLVSFLERTESYRRDLRRTEYGDERDPAMRAFLDRISPLTNAARIKVPLFVIHGRNDPRVPVNEAEQIVRTVSAAGVPVWSMIADNEGHGFAKKENADYAFFARVLFLRRYLLGGG